MSFATKILKFSPLGRISLFSYTKNERYINHFVALVTMVVIFCRHEKEAFLPVDGFKYHSLCGVSGAIICN